MKLYHGTTSDFASLIKAYGLDPEHARGFRKWEDTFYKGIRGTSTYVTTSLEQAQNWGEAAVTHFTTGRGGPYPMVVSFSVPEDWASKNLRKDRMDGPGNFLVREKIPPQWITSFSLRKMISMGKWSWSTHSPREVALVRILSRLHSTSALL